MIRKFFNSCLNKWKKKEFRQQLYNQIKTLKVKVKVHNQKKTEEKKRSEITQNWMMDYNF